MSGVDQTVSGIVSEYLAHRRCGERTELDYFRSRKSLDEAVTQAALARIDGAKLEHQWRLSNEVLQQSRRLLLDNLTTLRAVPTFDDLYDAVEAIIGPIHGIGELTVYDTALRIGAFLDLAPTKVYLHAGTRKGARALGLDWRARVLEMSALPEPLRVLSAGEAEDVLCIFKHRFDPSRAPAPNGAGRCAPRLRGSSTPRGCR